MSARPVYAKVRPDRTILAMRALLRAFYLEFRPRQGNRGSVFARAGQRRLSAQAIEVRFSSVIAAAESAGISFVVL